MARGHHDDLPRGHLDAVDNQLPFDDRMLQWPAGRRSSDGVWAPHWYASVEASTGFGQPRQDSPEVPERYLAMVEKAQHIHDQLMSHHLEIS